MMRRGKLVGVSAGVGAVFAVPASASAALIPVDSLADPTELGKTTLRDAIAESNSTLADNDTIYFASGLTGTINLTSPLPVSDKVTIYPSADTNVNPVTLSGGDSNQIFVASDDLTIVNLDLRDGKASALTGGAIYMDGGELYMERVHIDSSSSTTNGGAIAITGAGSAEIISSTISGNSAEDFGGGITVNGNSTVSINTSTFSGNSAGSAGGGISVTDNNGPTTSNAYVFYSTFGGNSATDTGPSFALAGTSSTFSAYHSLVAEPHNTTGYGATVSNSLVSPYLVGVGLGNIAGDPMLGPLKDNGGPTPTMLPARNGAGVDQGSSIAAFNVSDQRLSPRLFDVPSIANAAVANGPGTDLGSVELTAAESAAVPPAPLPIPSQPTFNLKAALKKCNKKKVKKAKAKCKKKARKKAKAAG
jgi:hypothetical protein